MSKEEEYKAAKDESSSQRDWQHYNSLYNKEVRRREESQKQKEDDAERQANLRYGRPSSSLGGSSSSGTGCVGALLDIIFPDDTFVKLFREIFRPVPLLVLLAELLFFPRQLVPVENLAIAGTIFIFSKSARSISGRLLLVIGIPLGGLFLLNVIAATNVGHHSHGADALIEQELALCLRGNNGASASGQTGCYETATRKWNDRLLNDQAHVNREFSRQPSIIKGFAESVKAMQSSTEHLITTATKKAAPGDKKLVAARTKYNLMRSRVTELESYLKKGTVPSWGNANNKK